MADTETLASKLNECAETQNFERAFQLVRENQGELAKSLRPFGIRDALKKTTKDRLLLAFLDGVEFAEMPLDKVLVRLEKLINFNANIPGAAGTKVLNSTWGLGTVKKIDGFYKRITVDFRTRKGHQFTFAAACDMLEIAPKDHILVLRETAPADFEALLKDKPGEFVKAVIRSNGGSMTMIRLEDFCVQNGFVKTVNWKKFWDSARVELKKNACVVLPIKKTEPIVIKKEAEDYGDGWMTAFAQETDPKVILAETREFVAQKKFEVADEATKAKINERLVFAVTAARKVDDALYARLACQVSALGFANPPASEMRDYLWERKRYIKAAAALPARGVGAMIGFLAVDDEAKGRLYRTIPDFCFTAVTEIVAQFGADPACRAAIGALMKEAKAPATLTTLIVGKIEQFGEFVYDVVNIDGKDIRVLKSCKLWSELPALITLLTHAIALGEGRQTGETLKMQNMVRRLFGDKSWLEKMFKLLDLLSPADKALFFERFQASIAWDPSTHHTTVIRMTKIVPALEAHVVKIEKKREYARITSYRSFGLRKQEYLRLINEEMPANVKRIEFAKSYGDLSENAEYQYAKDEQRALMQKQTLMQADLESVKPADFADATTDEVMPGVTVVIDAKDGEKTYTILGEWDNDLELGVISSKTRVAQNMLGKKVGDSFELPDVDGNMTFAKIREIKPLSDSIREWMKLPDGVRI